MNFNLYLIFNGNCAEAMTVNVEIFGGEITEIHTFGNSTLASGMPTAMHKLIMHVSLRIGDRVIMASDDPSGKYEPPRGAHVQTRFPKFAEAQRIFDPLAEGGEITMPFEKTFWTSGFGMLRDRFGIPWMVNCDDRVD
ncbi:MAG: VOC family protein [Paracoccaceae bacterium]